MTGITWGRIAGLLFVLVICDLAAAGRISYVAGRTPIEIFGWSSCYSLFPPEKQGHGDYPGKFLTRGFGQCVERKVGLYFAWVEVPVGSTCPDIGGEDPTYHKFFHDDAAACVWRVWYDCEDPSYQLRWENVEGFTGKVACVVAASNQPSLHKTDDCGQ